jgi:hypothetical protein
MIALGFKLRFWAPAGTVPVTVTPGPAGRLAPARPARQPTVTVTGTLFPLARVLEPTDASGRAPRRAAPASHCTHTGSLRATEATAIQWQLPARPGPGACAPSRPALRVWLPVAEVKVTIHY